MKRMLSILLSCALFASCGGSGNNSETEHSNIAELNESFISTSIDTDKSLTRRLPPPPEQEDASKMIQENEVLKICINSQGQIWVTYEDWPGDGDSHYIERNALRQLVKDFVKNEDNRPNWPSKVMVEVEGVDAIPITKYHVILVQADKDTPYSAYFNVQNELVAAYNELREEYAMKKWGKHVAELNEQQAQAVRTIYPQKIAEAESKDSTDSGQ